MKTFVKQLVRGIRAALPWLALVVALALLGAALYIGEAIWWVLSCFALVVVVYGLAYAQLSRACIRVRIIEDAAVVQRGEEFGHADERIDEHDSAQNDRSLELQLKCIEIEQSDDNKKSPCEILEYGCNNGTHN